MILAPLLSATAAVQLHVATVVPAFFLGTWLIVFSRKGARFHRAIGYVYLALMTVTAMTAFFIHACSRPHHACGVFRALTGGLGVIAR